MQILAVSHGYVGRLNAGAEWMLHSLLRWLSQRGHHCRVLVPSSMIASRVLDGVELHPLEQSEQIGYWGQVVLSQLKLARTARDLASRRSLPLVHLVHGQGQLESYGLQPALTVLNSVWLQEDQRWCGAQLVVRPPVWAQDYATRPNLRDGAITLINLSRDKGADLFWALARRLPARRFLGVVGAYGRQVRRRLANVELLPNTERVRDEVYARTRVLLVPSAFESFGRVGLEAASSGIPVLAHPAPGLRESLGSAGIYCDRRYPETWSETLERLDDPETYRRYSEAARARVQSWQEVHRCELIAWERALNNLCVPVRPSLVAFLGTCDQLWPPPPGERWDFLLSRPEPGPLGQARRFGVVARPYRSIEDGQQFLDQLGPTVLVGHEPPFRAQEVVTPEARRISEALARLRGQPGAPS
jgi:hypothetical protein